MLPCSPGAFFSAHRSFWFVCLFLLFSVCVVLVRRTVNAALRFLLRVRRVTWHLFLSVRALSLARLWTARFKIFPHILVGCGTDTTNHHPHPTSPLAVRPSAVEKGWTREAGWRRLQAVNLCGNKTTVCPRSLWPCGEQSAHCLLAEKRSWTQLLSRAAAQTSGQSRTETRATIITTSATVQPVPHIA